MRHNIAQEVDNRDCDSSSMESGSPKKRTTVRKSNPKLDFSSDSDTPHRKLRPRRNEKLSEAVIQKPGDVGNDNRHGSDFDSKLKVIIEPEDFVSTDFGKSNKMHSDENVVILKRMMDHIVSIMSDDEHKPQLEKMYGESEILEVKNLIKSGGNDREKVYQILKPSTLKIYKNLNQPEHIGLFKGCDIFSLKSSPSHNEKVNQIVAELLQSCSPDNKQSTSENVKKDKFIKRLFTTNNQTKEISESETKILDNETGISENGNKTRSTNKNRRHKLTNRRKKAKKIMKGQLQAESSPMIQEPDVLELTELTNNNKNDVLKENIDHTFEKEENFLPQNFSIASPKFYLTQNKKGIHKLIGRKDFVQEVIGNVVICGETEIEGSNRIVLSNDDIELDHQTEKKAFNSSNANKDFVNDSSSSDIELKKEISLATSKELVRRNVEVIEISDDSSNSDKDLVKHNNLNVESHEILSPQGSPLCEDGINKLTDQIKLSGSKENCFSELDSSRKVSNTSAETNLRNSPKNCIKTNKKLKVEDSSESSCSSNSGSDDESAKEDIQNPNLEIITQKDLECNEALQMHTSDQLKQSIEEDNSIKLTTKYNNTIEQSIHKDQKLPKHSAKDPELLKECSPFMDRFKEKKSNKSNAEVQLNKRKKEIKRHKVTERNHNKLLNEKQEMAEHKLKHDNEAPKKDKKKERKKRGRTNMNQNESTKTSKKPLEMANTTKNNSSISEPHISRKRTSKKLSKDNTDLDETMELLSKPNTSSRASPLIKKECEKQMKQKTLLKTVITKQEDEEVATRLPGYETDSSENEPTFNNGEVNLNKTSPNHCYEIKFNSDNFEPNQNDYIALEYDIGNNSDSSYEKMIKEINSAKLEKINNGSKENVACLNEESNEATFETSVGSKINGSDKFTVFTNNEILVKTAYVNNEPIGIMCPIDEGSFFSYKDKYQIRYTPELFVRKMKIKVRQQMELLKKPFMDNVVKNFMNKICEEYYKNGNCCSPLCVKKHLLPKEWYNMMADEEAWAITNLILTQAAQPPVSFCCSVLEWLGEVKKCKMKIMLVTEYFRRIKTFENCRTVWLAVLKALTISGFHEWEAVCCVLLYFYTDTCPSVTRNIMRYIGLEKRVYPNMWQSLQPLVEIGFQLPNTIIRSLLELLCHDKNNNFSNDAILLIGLQVKKMKPMNLQRMDTLIQKFLEIHKQIFPVKMPLKSCLKEANKPREEHNLSRKRSQTFSTEDHPLLKKPLILNTANSTSPNIRGVYEVEKVKAALLRSFKAKNTPDIANILFKYGGKKEYEVILAEELFTLIQPEKNAFQLIKDIIHEIRISGNMKHSILIMARVCITFMLHFVINFSDWKLAFDFLLLIRENHLNPIIMKPVCYEYSELRIAITCSEINFYNKHYNSAIAILINNKLLYEDSSKWQISGSSREFHFVKQIIQFLFINFNSAKMVDVSYTLFKSTMKSQNSLRVPIDLLDFYEPLLCNMFEKFDKYKHKLLSFYIQVNEIDSTVQLTGLSYRVLVIVAVRNDNFEVIKDLVSKAISTYVYPILEDKENVITLNTCLLQEEMKAYLVEWFRWDLNKSKDRSFLKHNVQIQFKLSKTDDFIECEQLPVPMILNSVDPSLNCAVRRLQAVLSEFTKVPFQALNIKMKNDALYVPPETTKLLIKSAKKMY
ncbi:uncharacterized protein LOC106666146 isoform X2 [Cimex lectularius]|uniref:Uncharacterized protein n=1 Tax=Cimex lectularius TaxID=79782 RepID=A0A8I6TGN9_CIMLE|nr:uncharacterized protein LOC106666146 isoform X2 [Cimex lectularius]